MQSNCTQNHLEDGVLFGMGNPLLDMMVHVDKDFLAKYNMEPNNAILAEAAHIPMYEELKKNHKVEFIAGGATQNVLRTVQWVVKVPNVTTFMGAVGEDENGKTLRNAATSDGVNVQYQVHPDHPTGTCAVLITGNHRSLCAYLAAAEKFTISHLESNFSFVEKAKFYYISGFFLTVSPDSALRVAEYASTQNRPFCFNLSAPFISQFFTDRVNNILPYVNILFGNEAEAKALSAVMKWDTEDVSEIASKLLALPKKSCKPRMVILTQGCDPAIVAEEGKAIQTFPVIKLAAEEIVDTNGAGDAFVGGFLAQYIQGKPLNVCMQCGLWTAYHVIRQHGCTFPKDVQFQEA